MTFLPFVIIESGGSFKKNNKKNEAKRHPQIFNLQSTIFNYSILSGLGLSVSFPTKIMHQQELHAASAAEYPRSKALRFESRHPQIFNIQFLPSCPG
jgi:hypothetical protein